jgi:hypothetical protein
MTVSYTPKIDKLLSVATELGFTEQDFADLALAAADQSGASLAEQVRIAEVLGISAWKRSLVVTAKTGRDHLAEVAS